MLFQDSPLTDSPDLLCENVLGAAIEVHREFGSGLLESFYQQALGMAMHDRGLDFRSEVEIRPLWRGVEMKLAYRVDMIVEDCLLLELKAVEKMHPVHMSQIMTYLKLTRLKRGYLLNFGMPVMKDGIKRVSI